MSQTKGSITTFYVRDPQGNPLAVYNNAHSKINWLEQHLYGSNRLGLWSPKLEFGVGANTEARWDTIGKKQYELTNHLDNVLATISDRRIQIPNTGNTAVQVFDADVITAQDYFAFGSLKPGRNYSNNGIIYRYGFNGKENDNDVKGQGNEQEYGMRI